MLKVGSTVWIFDENHRVYQRDEKGRQYGGPIYREHFVPRKIASETSRSWIVCGEKYDKKTLRGLYVTKDQIDLKCWENVHRYKIVRAVEHSCDAKTLKAIAELIGYAPTPEAPHGEREG